MFLLFRPFLPLQLHYSKHLFIPNFAGVKCGYVKATPENVLLKESCYEARTEKELAVLIEYIDSSKIESPVATHLDIILYSRDQIIKENEAMGSTVSNVTVNSNRHRDFLMLVNFTTATGYGCTLGHNQC